MTPATPGTRLPSVRELMREHGASPLTVQRAIGRLAAEGLVTARPGRGTFVVGEDASPEVPDLSWQAIALGAAPAGGDDLQALLELPAAGAVGLSGGYLDAALQPHGLLSAALGRAARRPGSWERGPLAGRQELRAWFARQAAAHLTAEDIIVCPGGQAALSTAFRALAAAGDPVLVESPTYLGAVAAARAAGLSVVPVPSDAEGVRPDYLADAFARTGARLVYLQPLNANPHGATLASERREPVLEAARAAGAFVLEDDWARDLLAEPDPPAPLIASDRHGHVVHVRSLTKVAAPGLRVAAIAALGPAAQRLRVARAIDDFYVAGPLQEAAVEVLTSPAWQRHLRGLRRALRERRDTLLAALRQQLPDLQPPAVPRGGLHLWQPLSSELDDEAVAATALAHGVLVMPGRPFFPAEPDGSFLRLTFAAAPPEALQDGAVRLARAIAAHDL
ncbi:MAG TPA: PLP-dependent aminotransferase family protein [Solirubrobacteraceae bacterium]|nr:PLP-dependent aminotransferase family protein [Solirubrobacteraceae bacterium]